MNELVFSDLKKLTSWPKFHPEYLYFPEFKTNFEREWEFWVSKLHGASLGATREDLEIVKNLVNKLG